MAYDYLKIPVTKKLPANDNGMPARTNIYPFLDFFAGSGLVSEGLRDLFYPIWANDICNNKARVFTANHPQDIFHLGPIEEINGRNVPNAILSWGSFPCQDLSLAGNMEGITSKRSGLVWQWLRVMDEMAIRPPIVVAENVIGLISSAGGQNYRMLHKALLDRDYNVGPLVIDASFWVPQSRKRVFIVAVDKNIDTSKLQFNGPIWCHPESLVKVSKGLDNWIWWKLPKVDINRKNLEDVIDCSLPCDDPIKSYRLTNLIPTTHWIKMGKSAEKGQKVFTAYKRIRAGQQVLELRFDGLAGCLRTPEGGSSRQFVIFKNNGDIKTRLITVKEASALMGVPESYKIPGSYNNGYKAMGDAVAVPVANFLAENLLYPIANLIKFGLEYES